MQYSVDVTESVVELLRVWCRYAVIPLAGLSRRSAGRCTHGHVMQAIITTLFNPLDAGRRSTDFAQTPYTAGSLLTDGTVYERSGW